MLLPQPSGTICPQPWPLHALVCVAGVQHAFW
jgi:hypothetical protein